MRTFNIIVYKIVADTPVRVVGDTVLADDEFDAYDIGLAVFGNKLCCVEEVPNA